jgi:CheY-like chemotaxis protein
MTAKEAGYLLSRLAQFLRNRRPGGGVRVASSDDRFQTRPLTEPPLGEDAAAPGVADGQARPAEGKLVLIVDDSADSAAFVSLYLQNRNYRVVTAHNGEEAVRVADTIVPDIILMDIAMPDVDGLEATRRIRASATLPYIPIIALTAFTTEGFKRAAVEVGIDGYLTKPVDCERLHQLISRLLRVAE